jgi:4-carboxymuconolactone decarboxylase
MARLPELKFAELTPEQREILAPLPSANRPVLAGPNSVYVRLPDVCASIRDLSLRLRNRTRLPERLLEIAVLTVVAAWRAQYAWCAHESGARAAGLPADVIEAIRRGDAEPPFEHDDERTIYALVRELQTDKRIAAATYARAHALLGEDLLIELVVTAGFYTMTAAVLDAFEVAVPAGQDPPFPESVATHAPASSAQ